jgi:hypothetical protein
MKRAVAVIVNEEQHIRTLRELCQQAEQLWRDSKELCRSLTEQLRFSYMIHPPAAAHDPYRRDLRSRQR